jgi:hypothetical protein
VDFNFESKLQLTLATPMFVAIAGSIVYVASSVPIACSLVGTAIRQRVNRAVTSAWERNNSRVGLRDGNDAYQLLMEMNLPVWMTVGLPSSISSYHDMANRPVTADDILMTIHETAWVPRVATWLKNGPGRSTNAEAASTDTKQLFALAFTFGGLFYTRTLAQAFDCTAKNDGVGYLDAEGITKCLPSDEQAGFFTGALLMILVILLLISSSYELFQWSKGKSSEPEEMLRVQSICIYIMLRMLTLTGIGWILKLEPELEPEGQSNDATSDSVTHPQYRRWTVCVSSCGLIALVMGLGQLVDRGTVAIHNVTTSEDKVEDKHASAATLAFYVMAAGVAWVVVAIRLAIGRHRNNNQQEEAPRKGEFRMSKIGDGDFAFTENPVAPGDEATTATNPNGQQAKKKSSKLALQWLKEDWHKQPRGWKKLLNKASWQVKTAFRLAVLVLFILVPGIAIIWTISSGYDSADSDGYDQHRRIMLYASLGIATYVVGLWVYAGELRRTGTHRCTVAPLRGLRLSSNHLRVS